MIESLKHKFKQLKLSGMSDYFELHYPDDLLTPQAYFDLISQMLDEEINLRTQNKQTRLLKQARLRWPNVTLNSMDVKHHTRTIRLKVEQLSDCEWVNNAQNVVITGATGVGKTTLACALARECILHLFSVRFYRFHELLLDLNTAREVKELKTFVNKLLKIRVLIIDDWGVAPLDEQDRHLLFELIERREKSGSLIITSQYHYEDWHRAFGDEIIADSVLDRIVHSSHLLVLKGDSQRKLAGVKGGTK